MVVSDTDAAVLSDQALSLLPPELATQLLLTRYVWAGTSAVRYMSSPSAIFSSVSDQVFIWDILSNLKGDYMLLFKLKHRSGWPVAAYFLSR
jgi:type VI protein secretion system component VasA